MSLALIHRKENAEWYISPGSKVHMGDSGIFSVAVDMLWSFGLDQYTVNRPLVATGRLLNGSMLETSKNNGTLCFSQGKDGASNVP